MSVRPNRKFKGKAKAERTVVQPDVLVERETVPEMPPITSAAPPPSGGGGTWAVDSPLLQLAIGVGVELVAGFWLSAYIQKFLLGNLGFLLLAIAFLKLDRLPKVSRRLRVTMIGVTYLSIAIPFCYQWATDPNYSITDVLNEQTGGDSYCYLLVAPSRPGTFAAYLLHSGRFPLSQVQIKFLDQDRVHEAELRGEGLVEAIASVQRVINLPYVRHGTYITTLFEFPVPAGVSSRSFKVFIDARNGRFTQIVRLRRVNAGWASATRVAASYFDKRKGLVREEISSMFPKDELLADKDWLEFSKLAKLNIESH